MQQNPKQPVLLAYPFRPFFLLAALYAALIVFAWVGYLFGGWPIPVGWTPMQWHTHEMLLGFVPAAIAGFLLTAMTNWTGAPPLTGVRLLALIGLWLAGRLVFWLADWLPGWVVAAVDLAFLPVLALYAGHVLLRYGNKRNLVLVAILALLTLANGLMHSGFISATMGHLKLGQVLALDVITLVMVVIAGRIVPAFSANWLRARGGKAEAVRVIPLLDKLAIGSVLLLLLAHLSPAPSDAVGALALLAGLLNACRLLVWCGWLTWREPLLWILHLAYAWIALALILRGLDLLTGQLPANLWQHTLGLGGIGTLIIGVMSRVAMGHTGRPMQLPRYGIVMFIAIIGATLLRLAAACQWIDYRLGVVFSALAWVLAFALFVVLYWPVLTSPRADGRPG